MHAAASCSTERLLNATFVRCAFQAAEGPVLTHVRCSQAGALAHAAAAKALAAERAVAAGAQHLAEDSAQRLAQGAGDMME